MSNLSSEFATQNPFDHHYVFTHTDNIRRDVLSWRDWLWLWMIPTYVQINDGYAFYFKRWQGRYYFLKMEAVAWRRGEWR